MSLFQAAKAKVVKINVKGEILDTLVFLYVSPEMHDDLPRVANEISTAAAKCFDAAGSRGFSLFRSLQIEYINSSSPSASSGQRMDTYTYQSSGTLKKEAFETATSAGDFTLGSVNRFFSSLDVVGVMQFRFTFLPSPMDDLDFLDDTLSSSIASSSSSSTILSH